MLLVVVRWRMEAEEEVQTFALQVPFLYENIIVRWQDDLRLWAILEELQDLQCRFCSVWVCTALIQLLIKICSVQQHRRAARGAFTRVRLQALSNTEVDDLSTIQRVAVYN